MKKSSIEENRRKLNEPHLEQSIKQTDYLQMILQAILGHFDTVENKLRRDDLINDDSKNKKGGGLFGGIIFNILPPILPIHWKKLLTHLNTLPKGPPLEKKYPIYLTTQEAASIPFLKIIGIFLRTIKNPCKPSTKKFRAPIAPIIAKPNKPIPII